MTDYTSKPRQIVYLDVSDIPRQRRFLQYPTPDGGAREYDLYYPSKGEGPFPVIVSISGGGWYFGHPTSHHLGRQIHTAVARGYAIASIACTSSGEQKFPYQLQEINLFLRHLREHAAQLNLDMGFLAMLSASSGAHLSLLSALTQGESYYDLPLSDPAPSVHAVAAVYPACRLDAKDEDFYALGLAPENPHSGPTCAESIFLGVEDVQQEPELVRLGSPTYQIKPDAPPVMILQGTADACIPYTLTLEFIRKYREIVGSDKILTHFIPGAGHSDPRFKDDEMCHRIMDFFDRVHRGETPCPLELQNKDL